jgi:RNA polymerase sigma factor (sigma-70 family)
MTPTTSSGEDGVRSQLITVYPAMRRFAAASADRDLDPDELVQEAFARVFRRWRDGSAPDDLGAYVRRTIVNLIANERRSRSRRRARRDEPPAVSHQPDYPSDLAAVLDQVAEIDRALLFLVDVEGLATHEAAALVGLTGVGARARLSRARKRLRDAIQPECTNREEVEHDG